MPVFSRFEISCDNWSICGKVCLVTDADTTLGRETALELVRQGAGRVILACRNAESSKKTVNFILENARNCDCAIVVRYLDLASLESTREFALQIVTEEAQLHVLVNNAGIFHNEQNSSITKDGFEYHFGVNFLGQFFLTQLLLPLLKKSAPSRILNVAASNYEFTWPFGFRIEDPTCEQNFAHRQSKLALFLFTRALNQRLSGSGVTCYCANAGGSNNDVNSYRHMFLLLVGVPLRFALMSPWQIAKTLTYLATQPGIEQHSGKLFSKRDATKTLAIATRDDLAEIVWNYADVLVKSKLSFKC